MTGGPGDETSGDDGVADDETSGDNGVADDETSGDGVTADYRESDTERLLVFSAGDRTAAIAQNREGYAMLSVRTGPDGDELERYYGLEMAIDHAAELLGRRPTELPIPEVADDMGM